MRGRGFLRMCGEHEVATIRAKRPEKTFETGPVTLWMRRMASAATVAPLTVGVVRLLSVS